MTLLDPPPASAPAPEQPARRARTPLSVAVWVLVAVAGAIAWGVVALSRGEDVSAESVTHARVRMAQENRSNRFFAEIGRAHV